MLLEECLKLQREVGALFPTGMNACVWFAGPEEWTPAPAIGL